MKLLIVAATYTEIESSISMIRQKQIDYLITGVGMTATAFALGKRLQQKPYDLILNVGIAGALDYIIPIGSTVQITTDIICELGAQDPQGFIPIDKLGFGLSTFTPRQPEDIVLELPKYTGITVNTVHGIASSIHAIRTMFPTAAIESMEGAAVFYAAIQDNVACLQVRAISNRVEIRNKSKWDIPLAIKNLNIWLQNFIEKHY